MNYCIFIIFIGLLWGSSIPSHGIYFNGHDSYIEFQDHESLDLTESFTIEFWAKPDSLLKYGQIMNKHQPGINDDGSWVIKYLEAETNNIGAISFEWPFKPNSTGWASVNFPKNWFHFAVCYSKKESNLHMWINGEKTLDQKILIQICA